MKFCSDCGAPVGVSVPPNDTRERFVCQGCGLVHYRNPQIIAGCLALCGDRVLLARRAIEPQRGLWSLPAGYLENGETAEQGAARETWEECHAHVEVGPLQALINVPEIGQIYLIFRADMATPSCAPGRESMEVGLFRYEDIPWSEIAYDEIRQVIARYFAQFKAQIRRPAAATGPAVAEPGDSLANIQYWYGTY